MREGRLAGSGRRCELRALIIELKYRDRVFKCITYLDFKILHYD